MFKPVAIKSDYKNDARSVIEAAIEQDFEAVVVVGYRDGRAWIKRSKIISRHQLIGAIEEAKAEIMAAGK